MKLSVIIPIYNVEPYIERCVRMLLGQDVPDVEYIFVDDGSPDGSIEKACRVAKEYPASLERVKILCHETNRGLPAARNTGMGAATGDYVFHIDSDDYLKAGALTKMIDAIRLSDADIIYTDWCLTFPKSQRIMREPECATPEEALRHLLHGTMKHNVWNKLVRRSLYTENGITFPEGHGMGEDMTMVMLFACAKTVKHLSEPLYHYMRENENAFTAHPSEHSYDDLRFNAQRVIDYLKGKVSEEDLACFKLNVKFPFIISGRRKDYQRWNEWFPEANQYIRSHRNSCRAKLLEQCASKKFYSVLQAYYYCFHKVIYSYVFR